MEKTERKWSAKIADGRTIGRKCAFVVGLHNDSAYEDCIASIELNHKEDAEGWFEKYSKIAECMNAHSELQAKASAYDRLMSGGNKTLKEWANFLGMNVAVEEDYWSEYKLRGIASDCRLFLKEAETNFGKVYVWANEVRGHQYEIPFYLIDYSGDWKDSLTMPDGWEESK